MSSSVGIQAAPPTPARRTVAHVPRLGQVTWTNAELDAHAELLHRTHRPDLPPVAVKVRWLPFPLPRTVRRLACCVSCALDWPCPEVRWAGGWLAAKRRFFRVLTHHNGT